MSFHILWYYDYNNVVKITLSYISTILNIHIEYAEYTRIHETRGKRTSLL